MESSTLLKPRIIDETAGPGTTSRVFVAARSRQRQAIDRLVPKHLGQMSRLIARAGERRPTRVVEALKTRFTTRAERARVHRVQRIALELDRSSLSGPHVQPATRRALGAGAGVNGRQARDLLLRLHEIRDQPLDLVGRAAAQHGRTGARHAEHREEPAAIHPVRSLFVGHRCPHRTASSGIRRSRE